MADRTVWGVDFSGAAKEGDTWISKGRLTPQGHLIIDPAYPIWRNDLAKLIQDAQPGTVVALDFPFGLPKVFLEYLGIDETDLRDVWPQITVPQMGGMSIKEFEDKCKSFGSHPKRISDYPVGMSPLNTRILRMTYHGMGMLHALHEQNPYRWHIPLLDADALSNDHVTLLEVMPGATLEAFKLPHENYKNSKGPKSLINLKNRQEILTNLSGRSKMPLSDITDFRDLYIFSDDALDSLVAAITAAKWARGDEFGHPKADEIDDAKLKLEGRFYVPKKLPSGG